MTHPAAHWQDAVFFHSHLVHNLVWVRLYTFPVSLKVWLRNVQCSSHPSWCPYPLYGVWNVLLSPSWPAPSDKYWYMAPCETLGILWTTWDRVSSFSSSHPVGGSCGVGRGSRVIPSFDIWCHFRAKHPPSTSMTGKPWDLASLTLQCRKCVNNVLCISFHMLTDPATASFLYCLLPLHHDTATTV